MKTIYSLILMVCASVMYAQTPCSGGTAGGFPCNGYTLQSHIAIANMGGKSYGGSDPMEAQDSWGWTDPQDGKEYALIGMNDGTAFVDISTPTAPRFLGRLESQTGTSWWRDVKVYNNYAYIVSDDNGNHGVQIFDLTRLRGLSTSSGSNASMRTFTQDGNYSGISYAHNIIINEDTGYLYILGSNSNSGAPRILDLSNPTNPSVAGNISSTYGYCHDAQVVIYDGPDPDHQGKEILIGSFSGTDFIKIIDVTNKTSITQISQIGYSNKFYTHQGWFTEDKRFFIVGDELDEVNGPGFNTRTLVFDIQDLDNPVLHHTYYGPTPAIDHNGYVVGNRFYLANYRAGMRVMKVDQLYDPIPNMYEVGSFDTHPGSNSAAYHGAWNVYPFFASGNIIISDLDQGLIVVKDPNFDNVDPVAVCQPFTAILDKTTATVTISATDLDGGSTDNFGIVKRTITGGQTTFTCDDVGSTFNVTLTVEDDYGNKSSCVATVTVAGETTTYTSAAGGSWSNGVPEMGSNAKISYDYTTATEGNIDACTCEVDATRTLTIAADNYLNITKDITVNGSLIVEHTGSVVQTDGSAVVTNNGIINVELTTPVLKTRDFMVMGSPMDAETRNGVFDSAFLVLKHTPANFIPHPDVPVGGTNFADDNGNFWGAYTGNITVGEGYIVRPQSGYTDPANHPYYMTYSQGTLNNGDVTRPIIFNGLGLNPDGTPNVLANPYASAISAIDLINANPLINEVYLWEHLTPPSSSIPGHNSINFSMGDISMYNLSGGVKAANDPGTSTTPNGVLSTGQGFGIKAFGAGSVTFTNAMRLTSGNTTLRMPNEDEIDRIRLSVSQVEYGIGSNTLIAFNPLATSGIDPGYDSNRLATAIALYSHLDDGSRQLGIQTREAFHGDTKIPMGFASQVDAETSFVISIDTIEGEHISNATVFLVDNQENIIHNLSEGSYEFKSGKGTFDQRFTLLFEVEEEVIVLGPKDSNLQAISVYPNPAKNTVNIYSPYLPIENIEVYDIRGRRIVEIMHKEEHNYQINLNELETAIYFVKVVTNSGSITKKIIKE